MQVLVTGVPDWIDPAQLLGPGRWSRTAEGLSTDCPPVEAAALQARLRGVVLAGSRLTVATRPALRRPEVREARLQEARARREVTPGFDRPGTRLDEEGRWSLTPAALALALASGTRGQVVFDACCGAGGNAIGFARAGARVVAVEPDEGRLETARHNAAIYGVSAQIRFVHGRAEDHALSSEADLWFVDPPWMTDGVVGATVAALDPLGALLALPHPALWAKVPPGFPPTELPGATPRAWFGAAAGDRHRVKFLTLALPPRAPARG